MKRMLVFVWMFLCAGLFASELQKALKETAEQFSASLKAKSVVAIIGIYSGSNDLSDFMLDELTLQFVRLRKITVADRANLEFIKKEMNFQLSGEVGDESIQQLGAKIGAETVIQGVLKQLGRSSTYILTIRALNVKTAAVTDMYRGSFELDKIEIGMFGGNFKVGKKSKATVAGVGFQNMLFGLGSYMKGHYGDGAFLTVTHLTAWVLLFSGLGCFASAEYPDYSDFEKGRGDPEYERRLDDYYDATRNGLVLVSIFPFIELTAIIYGFVRPHYYDEIPNIFADANNSGFKFDLALTNKGNIAPQVSYVYRY